MKIVSLLALTLSAALSFGQSNAWTRANGQPGSSVSVPYVRAPQSVTQSLDVNTLTVGSVACPGDDDSYLRLFDLSGDHGITVQYDITSVDIGIENSVGATLTTNLYTIAKGDAFLFANLTLIGTATQAVPDTALGFVNLPVTGTVLDPTTTDLVVEIFAADFNQAFTFFIGSNGNGQIAPSYLSATVCGAPEPTPTADIGFPNMMIVMIVNGDTLDCTVSNIAANLDSITIAGNCPSGLDVWCQTDQGGDVLIQSNFVVNGSETIQLTVERLDAIYYTTLPGAGPGIGNAVDGVVSNRTVPTLGQWGLIAFVVLLMGSGMFFLKRRRLA